MGFVELKGPVELHEQSGERVVDGLIEVEFPGGFVVRVRGAISQQSLASVVSVLMEAPRC